MCVLVAVANCRGDFPLLQMKANGEKKAFCTCTKVINLKTFGSPPPPPPKWKLKILEEFQLRDRKLKLKSFSVSKILEVPSETTCPKGIRFSPIPVWWQKSRKSKSIQGLIKFIKISELYYLKSMIKSDRKYLNFFAQKTDWLVMRITFKGMLW